MVDHGKKWCHFGFTNISGPNGNNWGNCLILKQISISPDFRDMNYGFICISHIIIIISY